MKKILFILGLMVIYLMPKAQTNTFKYLDSTCEWRYSLSGSGWGDYEMCTKYFDGDTIISGQTFFRVCISSKYYPYAANPSIVSKGTYINIFFMGEDTNHNFIVPDLSYNPPHIKILYNFHSMFGSPYSFGITQNNIFFPDANSCYNMCAPLDGYNNTGSFILGIQRKDTFHLGSQNLIAYNVDTTYSNYCFWGYRGIIEGVGSPVPFFESAPFCSDVNTAHLNYFDKQNNRISLCSSIIHDSFPTPIRGLAISGFRSCQPLPLKFLSFSAQKENNNVLLNCQTANEINVSHFNILRSIDGVNFKVIGKQKANGASYNEYSFIDAQFPSLEGLGVGYYKIESVDFDGRKQYSEVRQLAIDNKKMAINIFPNPAKNLVMVECKGAKELLMIDYLGRTIIDKKIINNQSTIINVQGFLKGVYVVKIITNNGETKTEKLIVE